MMLIIKKLMIALVFFSLCGCDNSANDSLSGFVSGDFVYLSHNQTEKVKEVFVEKGMRVKKGQRLVLMDQFITENARHIADKNYQAELALLRNLQTGERSEELDIIRSQLERANSAADMAKNQMNRYRKLYQTHVISGADWDAARDDYIQKMAQVKELTSQLKAKNLPARSEQIKNQESRVESARLQLDKALWDEQQNVITAPMDALVYDIIYLPGERPVAGRPVMSLLPPENIKVRFFVPEKKLGALSLGQKVRLSCDGCSKSLSGNISYISAQAEYTPPVIYSASRREKLLFMAEARPDQTASLALKAGQPVEVGLVFNE